MRSYGSKLRNKFELIFIFNSSQVLYEYTLIFKNSKETAFVEFWPSSRNKLKNYLYNKHPNKTFAITWSDEIQDFLIFLKLLPYKSVGRNNVANTETFQDSIKKLMLFCEVIFFFCTLPYT